jgi:putative ABC transport system permease protein
MGTFWSDLRYALRTLAQRPGFTAVAALTLALGIGANTAIFSRIDATLLRKPAFADPDRLALVWGKSGEQGFSELPLSLPNFLDLRAQSRVFEELAAWVTDRINLSGGNEPEQLQYALVTSNFFTVLGVRPVAGRAFLPAEEQPGCPRIVVLSHSLWQRRFGGAPDLVGRSVTLDGVPHEVVGILPAGFRFASFPRETDVWMPFGLDPFQGRRYARGAKSLGAVGRLKQGVALSQAQADLDTVAGRLEQEHPDLNKGLGLRAVPLQEQAVRNMRPALFVLLGAVSFVLLIACANVASLLLARATSRRREMAVRAALGAGRLRLVRQLLTESVCLALAGGLLGLTLASWAGDLLAYLAQRGSSPFVPYTAPEAAFSLDARVLGFTFLLSVLTGVLFGLVPALQASRTDLSEALKEGGLRGTGLLRHGRARSVLVVAEVALSLTLLVGAGLLLKSFLRLVEVPPGFRPEHVLTMDASLPQSRYDGAAVARFYRQLLERVSALPGVESAGAVTLLPLSGEDSSTGFFVEGQPPPPPAERPHTHHRAVSAGYFQALGVELVQGRGFTDADSDGAPRVAIVNQTMARRLFPGADAVGKRVALDFEAMHFYQDRPPDLDIPAGLRTIVGVAADVRHAGLDLPAVPEMYVPYLQQPARDMTLVVRSTLDPGVVAEAVAREVRALDKDQPVSNVRTMSQLLGESVAAQRFNLELLGAFAVLALVLAAVGLFGVVSYGVGQRTHEIGVRMALGAQARDVLRLVVGQGMGLVLLGLVLGLGASWGLTRFLSSLLFEVSATDPAVFAGVSALLAAVALAASVLPGRRAMSVDPAVALRDQ